MACILCVHSLARVKVSAGCYENDQNKPGILLLNEFWMASCACVWLKNLEARPGFRTLNSWQSFCYSMSLRMMSSLRNMKSNGLNAGSKTRSFVYGHEFESQIYAAYMLDIETNNCHLRSPLL